jgi:hypothetical protein
MGNGRDRASNGPQEHTTMSTTTTFHASHRIAGMKRQWIGAIRIRWALITGNAQLLVTARRERLLGFLQRLYGMPSHDIESFVERWVARQSHVT